MSMGIVEAAVLAERERIIELIKESGIGRCCFESHDLIALINGDN